ncbi:MAG: histidine--tRNA ligase, partial [Bacilli bacterium]|nr:histidine--tRNA ligase [Bacilli bacterium]
MAINAVKGTHDLFGEEADGYAYIQNLFKAVAKQYGYQNIETPILEHTEVFTRSTGEASDVVRKEMYTFLDKGDRSLTLRPEGTAGVIRSIVEKKLYATNDLPLKVFYAGPVFRYERPQLGRYRQFTQAGVEAVGEDSPRLDAECIALAMRALAYLGFKNLVVKVNTLGDAESRLAYKEALKAYFADKIDGMCEDCHQRLELNPMRILDCKVPEDQKIAQGAPKMKDYLSLEAGKRFYET